MTKKPKRKNFYSIRIGNELQRMPAIFGLINMRCKHCALHSPLATSCSPPLLVQADVLHHMRPASASEGKVLPLLRHPIFGPIHSQWGARRRPG